MAIETEMFRKGSDEVAKDPRGNAEGLIDKMESATELDIYSPLGDRIVLRRLDDNYSVNVYATGGSSGKVRVGTRAEAVDALCAFLTDGSAKMEALRQFMEMLQGMARDAAKPDPASLLN